MRHFTRPCIGVDRDKIDSVRQPNGINQWYSNFHGCLHSTNVCADLNLA